MNTEPHTGVETMKKVAHIIEWIGSFSNSITINVNVVYTDGTYGYLAVTIDEWNEIKQQEMDFELAELNAPLTEPIAERNPVQCDVCIGKCTEDCPNGNGQDCETCVDYDYVRDMCGDPEGCAGEEAHGPDIWKTEPLDEDDPLFKIKKADAERREIEAQGLEASGVVEFFDTRDKQNLFVCSWCNWWCDPDTKERVRVMTAAEEETSKHSCAGSTTSHGMCVTCHELQIG
jgi:hypothetical protein